MSTCSFRNAHSQTIATRQPACSNFRLFRLSRSTFARNFACPKSGRVAVPKTAVHKTHGMETPESKIRRSRQLPIVETVSESARMQGPTENQFWLGILAAYTCHHPRAGFLVYHVDHEKFPVDRELHLYSTNDTLQTRILAPVSHKNDWLNTRRRPILGSGWPR